MTLNSSINVAIIGSIVALIGMLLSGVITFLYLKKAKSSQVQLTQKALYIYPIIVLTGVSLITCSGLTLMFMPSTPLQITFRDWVLSSIIPLTCTGFLLLGLIFSYLVNLWWWHKLRNDQRH